MKIIKQDPFGNALFLKKFLIRFLGIISHQRYQSFNKLNIDTIIGAAEVENIASNSVLQKIGLQFKNKFTYENTPCNWYELNKEDYAKTMS